MKLDIKLKNYLENELSNYGYSKKQIEEIREDIIAESNYIEYGMPKTKNYNYESQTEKVYKLLTDKRIKRLTEITKAIEKVLNGLSEYEYKFYEEYYKKGNNRIRCIYNLGISERTFSNYRSKIVLRLAEELGYI